MTTQETYIIMKMIQSYYPMFDTKDEIVNKCWSAEFMNLNFEICKKVVKNLCRERERIYPPRLNEIIAGCEDEKTRQQNLLDINSNRYVHLIDAGCKYYKLYDKVTKKFIQTDKEIPDWIFYHTSTYCLTEEQKRGYEEYWNKFKTKEEAMKHFDEVEEKMEKARKKFMGGK